MSGQVKSIAPLIAAVQIEDVRLVEAVVRSRIRSPQDVDEVDCVFSTSASVKEHHKGGSFVVLAAIDLKLVPRKSPDNTIVSIDAGFALSYSLPPEFVASRRDLDMFAQINSVFNVWPYWREFIQSMTARMHLPPLVLPVFRLREAAKTIPRKTSRARRKLSPVVTQPA